MKYYELTYLISLELSNEEINSIQEKIKTLIQNGGGVLSEVNPTIKKGMLAYLATLNFQLSPEKLESLEKKLRPEGQILRYIILARRALRPSGPEAKKVSPRLPKVIKPKSKPKVELKEIEKKLEEILGE